MNLGKTISGGDGAPMSSPGLGVLVLSIVSSKKKGDRNKYASFANWY